MKFRRADESLALAGAIRRAISSRWRANMPRWAIARRRRRRNDGLGIAFEEEGRARKRRQGRCFARSGGAGVSKCASRFTPKPICLGTGPRRNTISGMCSKHEGQIGPAGDKAAGLLDQAVEAFRGALEVCTKADLPQDWARTQNNLGIALMDRGRARQRRQGRCVVRSGGCRP